MRTIPKHAENPKRGITFPNYRILYSWGMLTWPNAKKVKVAWRKDWKHFAIFQRPSNDVSKDKQQFSLQLKNSNTENVRKIGIINFHSTVTSPKRRKKKHDRLITIIFLLIHSPTDTKIRPKTNICAIRARLIRNKQCLQYIHQTGPLVHIEFSDPVLRCVLHNSTIMPRCATKKEKKNPSPKIRASANKSFPRIGRARTPAPYLLDMRGHASTRRARRGTRYRFGPNNARARICMWCICRWWCMVKWNFPATRALQCAYAVQRPLSARYIGLFRGAMNREWLFKAAHRRCTVSRARGNYWL